MSYQFPDELLRLETVISRVSGVSVEDIRGEERRASFVSARHAIWCLAVRHMSFHVTQVAKLYGRDHTTILHAARKYTQEERAHLRRGVEQIFPDAFSDDMRMKCRHFRVDPHWMDELSTGYQHGDNVTVVEPRRV